MSAAVLCFSIIGWSCLASADVVVPSADVTTGVTVRSSASTQSASVGILHPGEQATLLGSVQNWERVQLANGVLGYVSKRWTQVIAWNTPPPPPPPTTSTPAFTIDVVDVGTGLGILVRGADFTLVYDAGSNDDLARGAGNRMLAYMKAVAPTVTTLDHVVLSHPHRDHVELLPDLFDRYTVKQVWDSGRLNDICGYRAFLKAVRDHSVPYHNALQAFGTADYAFKATTCYGAALPAETVTLTLDSRITNTAMALGTGATMTILHADGAPYPSPNDNTLVVRLDLGPTRVLLMGDAQAGARADPSTAPDPASIEGVLLACCVSDLASQIMVVGHHGSKTSSRGAFLDAVGASTFVVSSGPTVYGTVVLPDAVIIDELTARGQVFRTDLNDATCGQNPAKIGPDNDGKAGGCDNVRITIPMAGLPTIAYWRAADSR